MNEEELKNIIRRVISESQSQRQSQYTPKQVASMLGREASTVREWARLGRIRASKHGRYFRIPADEVERLQKTACTLLPPNPDKLPPSQRQFV